MVAPTRTIHRARLLAAAFTILVIEVNWAPGHAALSRATADLLAWWGSSTVQLWPMTAWKAVLEGAGLPTTQAHGLAAAALLVGLPLLIVGGVIVEVVWMVPYVLGALLLGLASVAVTLHLLPTVGAAALACRLVPEWRDYFFPARLASPICVTPARAEPAPSARFVIAARPAASASGARLCTMGPEFAHLANRRDAMTSSGFEPGERFILCGGACARPYKLITVEFFEARCPRDGSSLRPVNAPAVSEHAASPRPGQ